MAQCVAEDLIEQQACWFSSQSGVRKACMHLNTNLDNHCWNPEAHVFSREHGVVRLEDVEEEITLDDEILIDIEFPDTQRRDCRCCILHPCHVLIQKADAALHRGGLADVEYWDIGTNCPEFMDESMMKATYNSNP
jgi:hypothetical protein